ncbi:MAG: hypothetical protein ACK40I_05825, partial [Tabrizicola sp.]
VGNLLHGVISLAVAAAGWVGVSSPGDYAAIQFLPLPRHDLELGPFRNDSFRAFVTEGDLDQSLLGMDYLGQFRMEFAGGKLILRQ